MGVDFKENCDIENFDNDVKMKEINTRIEINFLIINLIKTLFEDFQTTSEELLDLFSENLQKENQKI